ncbi:MAG: 50S ribosomal protein L11 methyltransferase [Pseudomonadales bacterium]|jgi:ribosomal protein L11 methyltransferase
MGWLRLTLDLDADQVESAEALLDPFVPLSVSVRDAGANPILEPDPGATPLWSACTLEALFELDVDVPALREALLSAGFTGADVGFLDDADWLNRWRQYAVDFCFGDRLWLVPRDARAPGEPALRLDPGLAFGSGSHPTTRLCLTWLAGADLSGRTVLDYGCGSGILGLAALKLGAASVLAVDHDPQALLATRENAAYNALDGDSDPEGHPRLQVGLPDALGERRFDLVLANILANPLIELSHRLAAALRSGGTLILSGMLEYQVDEVMAAYPELDFQAPVLEADEQGARWARLEARRGDPRGTRSSAAEDNQENGP